MGYQIKIDLDQRIIEFMSQKAEEKLDLEEKIEKIVRFVLEEQKIMIEDAKIHVSIQSATCEEIQEINREYRNIDRATDVLSFPIFSREEIQEIIEKKGIYHTLKEMELGDIIICLEVVEKQAKEYETGILREMLYMITHGMCHLTGHDHEILEEKLKMRELEELVLKKVGVGIQYEE